jgi:hypothetical protein
MQARILTEPPQTAHIFMSMLNARFKRAAQSNHFRFLTSVVIVLSADWVCLFLIIILERY